VIITYSSSDAYSNPLATLNMADIESINVLKDASALPYTVPVRETGGTHHYQGKIGRPKSMQKHIMVFNR
jgi:hypothetical protein